LIAALVWTAHFRVGLEGDDGTGSESGLTGLPAGSSDGSATCSG
jgi:hypothetical protein